MSVIDVFGWHILTGGDAISAINAQNCLYQQGLATYQQQQNVSHLFDGSLSRLLGLQNSYPFRFPQTRAQLDARLAKLKIDLDAALKRRGMA